MLVSVSVKVSSRDLDLAIIDPILPDPRRSSEDVMYGVCVSSVLLLLSLRLGSFERGKTDCPTGVTVVTVAVALFLKEDFKTVDANPDSDL